MTNKTELISTLKDLKEKVYLLLCAIETDKDFPIEEDFESFEEITTLLNKAKFLTNGK